MSTYSLVLLLFLLPTSLAYKTFNKTRSVSFSTWNSVNLQSNKGRIVYIDCSDNLRSNCTVVAEKSAHTNESISCKIPRAGQHDMVQLELQGSLGSDRIVLVWKEFLRNKYIFQFGILLTKECRLVLPEFDEELLYKPAFILRENGFDVFFKNSKLCEKKLCRTSFDIESGTLKSTHGYVENDCSRVKPIASDFSEEVLFYFCIDNQEEHMHRSSLDGWIQLPDVYRMNKPMRDGFYLIKSDGTKKFLAEDNGRSFTSTTHEYISICSLYDSYINCTQVDVHGHLKFNRILAGGVDDYIEILDIYNLPQGGFLLLLKEYWNCKDKSELKMCYYVTLGKFDAKGKIVGSRIVDGYYGAKLDLYEDEEGNYCTLNSHAVKSSVFGGERKVNFSYKCFNITDLSRHLLTT